MSEGSQWQPGVVHPPLTRRETQAQTRARLVAAAAQVFSTRGFAPSSLRQVAEEAGLTTGAIYSNFQSKAELAVAVLDEQLHRPQYDIFGRVDGSLPYDEQLRQASKLLVSELDAGAPWFQLELECIQAARTDSALAERLRERHDAIRDELAQRMAERLTEIGARSSIPLPQLAETLMATTNGIALTRLYAPGALAEEAIQHVLLAIYAASITID